MTSKRNKRLTICDEINVEECRPRRSERLRLKKTSDENKTVPVSSTTLQDLPIEVLDYILMKAVVKKVMDKKLAKCAFIGCAYRMLQPMRRVWSQWDYRLMTNWFEIVLKRILNKKNPATISGTTTVSWSPWHKGQLGVAQLGDTLYFLDQQGLDFCVLSLFKIHDLTEPTVLVELPLAEKPTGIALCERSSAIYLWGCDPHEARVFNLTLYGRDGLTVLRWPDYAPPSNFTEGIDTPNNCTNIESFSVLDDGNLLIMRYACPCKEEMMIVSVQQPDGLVIRNMKLPWDGQATSNIEMKSNGNFVYALLDDQAVLEVDQDGREIRRFVLREYGVHSWLGEHLFLDSYDRVILQDGAFDLVVLDAELNFLELIHLEHPDIELEIGNYGVSKSCFCRETNEMTVLLMKNKLRVVKLGSTTIRSPSIGSRQLAHDNCVTIKYVLDGSAIDEGNT